MITRVWCCRLHEHHLQGHPGGAASWQVHVQATQLAGVHQARGQRTRQVAVRQAAVPVCRSVVASDAAPLAGLSTCTLCRCAKLQHDTDWADLTCCCLPNFVARQGPPLQPINSAGCDCCLDCSLPHESSTVLPNSALVVRVAIQAVFCSALEQ
jgi:hypothetical protein